MAKETHMSSVYCQKILILENRIKILKNCNTVNEFVLKRLYPAYDQNYCGKTVQRQLT